MTEKSILIAVDDLNGKDLAQLDRLKAAGFDLRFNDLGRAMAKPELIDALPGVVAAIAGGETYDRDVFEAAPELRVVARLGVGYDKVDTEVARKHGVAVITAIGGNHDAVADYAMGMILSLGLSLVDHDRALRDGQWQVPFHRGVWGRTLGLLGLGRIGRAVAKRAHGFGMQILAYDPVMDPVTAEAFGVELTSLHRLLRQSDFVSIHLPLNSETRNMIGGDAFALMKPEAYLINTARGGQIDETALIEALRTGAIAGAALDVFASEPLPADDPLRTAPNLLLSPHCSAMDSKSVDQMLDITVDNVLAGLKDPRLTGSNWINP